MTTSAVTPPLVDAAAWDRLHARPRFCPVYPSEPVVRFVSRRFGGVTEPPGRAADLLDLGCGAGRHAVLMARAGHRVTALDYSAAGLVATGRLLAAEGLAAELVEAGMLELPFADAAFDGVVAYAVLLHTDGTGFRRAVEEARRVLRPGGWLHVVTRTVDDDRYVGGQVLDGGTALVGGGTNEDGMVMHFLDREGLDDAFSAFDEVLVDRCDHTAGGGAIRNSDWVIEARR